MPAGQACILPALSRIAQGPPMARGIQNSGQGIALGMNNGNFRVLPKSPWQMPTPLGVSGVLRPPLPSCHPHSVPYMAHPFPAVLKCHLRSNMAGGMEHVGLSKRPHQVGNLPPWSPAGPSTSCSWARVLLRSLTRDGETHSDPTNQLGCLEKQPQVVVNSMKGKYLLETISQ